MLRLIGSTIELIISTLVNTIGVLFAVGNGIGYTLLCIGGALLDTLGLISQGAVFVYEELRIFVQDVDVEYMHIVKIFHNRLINIVGDAIGAAQNVIAIFVWTFDASKAFTHSVVHRWMEWFALSAVASRSVCVLIGNSTWMLIMLIPNIILFLAKKLIQMLNDLLGIVVSIAVATVSGLMDTLNTTVDYFTAFPLHSVFGLFAIFLAIKYHSKTLGLIRVGLRRVMILVMYVLRKVGNMFLAIFIVLRFIFGIFTSALELRQRRHSNLNETVDVNPSDNADDGICNSALNKSNGNSNLCVICQDQPKSIVLLPCRHLCLCRNCTYHLQSYRTICPLCRERFCETIQVYV